MDKAQIFKNHAIPACQVTCLWSYAVAQPIKDKLARAPLEERPEQCYVKSPRAIRLYELKQLQQRVWDAIHMSANHILARGLDSSELLNLARSLDRLTVSLVAFLQTWVPHDRWPAYAQALLSRQLIGAHCQLDLSRVGQSSPGSVAWGCVEDAADAVLALTGYCKDAQRKRPLLSLQARSARWTTLARNSDWTAVVHLLLGGFPREKVYGQPWLTYGSREGRLRARDRWRDLFGAAQLSLWDGPTENPFKLTEDDAASEAGTSPTQDSPITCQEVSQFSGPLLPSGVRVSTVASKKLLLVSATYHVLDELSAREAEAVRGFKHKMPKSLEKEIRPRNFQKEVPWQKLGEALQEAANWMGNIRESQEKTLLRLKSFQDQQALTALKKKLESTFTAEEIKALKDVFNSGTSVHSFADFLRT